MGISIRDVMRIAGPVQSPPRTLRGILGTGGFPSPSNVEAIQRGTVRFSEVAFPFSLLTYNLALMVDPGVYGGPSAHRSAAIGEFIRRVRIARPDAVGVCEAFADAERTRIIGALRDLYPSSMQGPDEEDLENDGGLILLCRHPFVQSHASIFRQSADDDSFANKGVLHMRVVPPGLPCPVDLFYSHTQNTEDLTGAQNSALFAQLEHIEHMWQAFGDVRTPAFVFGDLNFPGEHSLYPHAMARLGDFRDAWVARGVGSGDGLTWARDNNFYEDASDRPSVNEQARLDYVMLHSGRAFAPALQSIAVQRWQVSGRDLSDHFGLLATFSTALRSELTIEGSIQSVDVRIWGFRCIEESDELGDDEVHFECRLIPHEGTTTPFVRTATIEGVATGEVHTLDSSPSAVIGQDPGDSVTVEVRGTEEDDAPNPDDDLGTRTLVLPRAELLRDGPDGYRRVLPYLTRDGAEYGVEVFVQVSLIPAR